MTDHDDHDMPTAEEDGLDDDESLSPVEDLLAAPSYDPEAFEDALGHHPDLAPRSPPKTEKIKRADVAPKPPAPSTPTARAVKATGARWICSGCGATWTEKPASKHHSHSVPVPGSKSRVTYENHRINEVAG